MIEPKPSTRSNSKLKERLKDWLGAGAEEAGPCTTLPMLAHLPQTFNFAPSMIATNLASWLPHISHSILCTTKCSLLK
jgi:hypothetical protein